MVAHHGALGTSWTRTTGSLGAPLAWRGSLGELLLQVVSSPLHVIDLLLNLRVGGLLV